MDTPSFREDHISQIPAFHMLVNLGCISSINQNMLNKVGGFIVQKQIVKHGI